MYIFLLVWRTKYILHCLFRVFGILRKRVFYDFFFPIAIRKKDDLPKKLAICFSSIQSESLVRDLEMEEGKITIIKSM